MERDTLPVLASLMTDRVVQLEAEVRDLSKLIHEQEGYPGIAHDFETMRLALKEAQDTAKKALEQRDELAEIAKNCEEELRLIRTKDTGVVYDTTLRMRLRAAIAKLEDK